MITIILEKVDKRRAIIELLDWLLSRTIYGVYVIYTCMGVSVELVSNFGGVGLGDFNCPISLGMQAHLYTRQINLGPIDNEAFSGAGLP